VSIYTCNECKDAAFQTLRTSLNDKIIISKEEAKGIAKALKSNWIPLDDQKLIYQLIDRIERELGLE